MYDSTVLDAIDPRDLRDCCGRFATGVNVITTRTDEGDHGMTASAFMSVSLDPPLICISVSRSANMLDKIRESGRYAVNVLPEGMRGHALHFAGRGDGTLTEPFQSRHGLPVLPGAAALIIADVAEQIEAGDHILFLGHVRHLDRDPAASPLLYHAGQFGGLAAPAST
ncbi:flavin reductase family protein [Paracoccus xiamenensis]|uniref:flavin reductase family protein n=1 Tax=Paracoccus xiamenensis TaxID=2714901 RepID=UPI00140732FF|nr:flavin reductase family protein [Paracoccus xiamenensis]NHF74532.1 flavin reductase family protein [Paracoccus xiamenensis]